ncbi:MAG: hypothetical protein A7315_03520 [Candidatus Altiarchaeales archaeon WOR_SM1_79]|nr:MAG: hypothetical protein A7315_03520 [Candidatus Altiarchaeales archaeon WOR_SM1_79]
MSKNNLDYLCAEKGQEIPKSKDDETIIQKALGVLQEDGVYAFVIFLESKKEDKTAKKILEKIAELFSDENIKLTDNATKENIREKILELTKNIDNIFFAKDIIERTLIYARYHAKAK